MKIKLGLVILILAFVGWIVFCVVTGVSGLTKTGSKSPGIYSKKGELCEMEAYFAKEVYALEHRINGIIPAGTEHFYIIVNEDGSAAPMLVKAKPSWYSKNFDSECFAKGEVIIKGEVREFGSESTNSLLSLNDELAAADARISTDRYLDMDYKMLYILRLLMGGLLISGTVVMTVTFARIGSVSKQAATAAVIYTIIVVLACLALGYIMIAS